jgi:hypothetical protein
MGDLPGSPSVAPSPLFCTALWGGEGVAAGLPSCPSSPRSVVNTIGGQKHRHTEVVSTPLYVAPLVATELAPFSPSSSFSLFLFPPTLFSLLLRGERSCSGGSICGMRHQLEKSQIHRASCNTAGEKIADAGYRFERS